MTMNSSGQISLGGTTAGESIELENGGPGTAQISLDDTAVRSLAGVPGSGTTIVMPTNFYGKSNTVYINITIAANTQNYCVWGAVAANPTYVAGKTAVTVTVNPGVFVGATSTGAYAMYVPACFNASDTVTIVNNGRIQGAGGGGGRGGGGGPSGSGGGGGNALYLNRPTTITNNAAIAGGGGGGGGGGSPSLRAAGGGGGGSGYNAGGGGAGGTSPAGNAGSGTPGNTCGGGGGGGGTGTPAQGFGGTGGSGGGLGAGGASGGGGTGNIFYPASGGGGAGNYIVGNAFATWPAVGSRYGGAA